MYTCSEREYKQVDLVYIIRILAAVEFPIIEDIIDRAVLKNWKLSVTGWLLSLEIKNYRLKNSTIL